MQAAIARDRRKTYSPHSELFGSRQSAGHTRCCVIAAHPNDEIVGGGCLISRLSDVRVIHISTGAPRTFKGAGGFAAASAYAEARRQECVAALALARVRAERVVEFGLAQLDAPFQLGDLARRLLAFLQKASPQIVLTHAYEGGHPDHDATAFGIHAAVRLLKENGLKPPVIFEMALYPGTNGNRVPEFLQSPARESTTLLLDNEAQDLKRRMFRCFKSQQHALDYSPLGPEKFRQAPSYEFTLPPRAGTLHYENFNWGLTGEQWRGFAFTALDELFPKRASAERSTVPEVLERYLD